MGGERWNRWTWIIDQNHIYSTTEPWPEIIQGAQLGIIMEVIVNVYSFFDIQRCLSSKISKGYLLHGHQRLPLYVEPWLSWPLSTVLREHIISIITKTKREKRENAGTTKGSRREEKEEA
jgi:hypothetical protein